MVVSAQLWENTEQKKIHIRIILTQRPSRQVLKHCKPAAYLELSQTSAVELFCEVINFFRKKSSIVDGRLVFKNASAKCHGKNRPSCLMKVYR